MFPDYLIKEWHPKNAKSIYDMHLFSNQKVWWICSKGHEWQAVISNRTKLKRGCPYCCNQLVDPNNSLSALFPELIKEWHPSNYMKPTEVSIGSGRKVLWICSKGHEWQAIIKSRTRLNGSGCPYCKGTQLTPYTNLNYLYPQLIKEWSIKNAISPSEVAPHSNKKFWWICKQGHEWMSTPSDRVRGTGCPICNESKGEKKISKILTANKINYQRQWKTEACKYYKSLPFDFALFINNEIILIEYQGIQHYQEIPNWEPLSNIQMRDKIKKEFCNKNNIKLIEIPYWNFDQIDNIIKDII